MPLNRQILHRVQDLFSRAARGLLRKGGAAEEERAAADMLLSARWASNASASSSMTSTFASSSSASSVRSRASIVSSLSWPDHNCPRDLLRGTQEISLLSRGAVARKRSFLTRPAAVAAGGNGNAGGGRGKRNNKSGSGDRRRSSSTSNAVKTNRRIQPQAPPPPPPSPLARRGQRQWRTLLEDEVRFSFRAFSKRKRFCSSFNLAHLHPLLHNTQTTAAPSPRRGDPSGDPRDHEQAARGR